MPKGIEMLAKQALKQLKEDSIQVTIDGTLNFLSAAYVEIEKVNNDDEENLLVEKSVAQIECSSLT